MSGSPQARPTIAFLVDHLFDGFQATLWSAVVTAARDEGANLLCFLGGSLLPAGGGTAWARGRNAVYDLVDPATVDGILSLSGSVGCFVGAAEMESFLRRYAPLPILNLCAEVGGHPSVLVDNRAGVRQLMDHLLGRHGRRRVAFIRGPATSVEAELRFEAYRAALEAHGLPFEPALVFDGGFDRNSGLRAVRAFLDERRLPLDAVVAANDLMALYAMAELSRRGIDVPGRVAVAGFDDVLDASIAVPSLTSVRQPFEELARTSVRRLLAMIRGEPVPPLELLPPQPVARRSCGCTPAERDRSVENAQIVVGLRAFEEETILRRIFQPNHLSEEEFRQTLLDELPTLGIGSFALCRYRDQAARSAELWALLDARGDVLPQGGPGPFPSLQLLPGGLRPPRPHAHAVLPLHYQEERIGYALCEVGSMAPTGYETLSTQISTVFEVMALVGEVRRHASELEGKVAERTRQLREAQRQLLETAHHAGMAEVAVGVLHNVGNLLNSVSVCAEQIADHGAGPHAAGLRKAAALLASHRSDLPAFFSQDPRAALLPDYLARVAEGLSRDDALARDEARQLLEKVDVIRDTIGALQALAREGRTALLRDDVDLRSVVDTVLEIQAPLLTRHSVALRKDLGDQPLTLVTDRAKLIHVLVNVVKNAVEAMRATSGDRTLTVLAGQGAQGRVRVVVSDTGEGIPPQNLDRIFSYGFTTKPDGHGFGLHTCALYAAQLGGSLSASSPGPDRGAAFTLVLPRERATAS